MRDVLFHEILPTVGSLDELTSLPQHSVVLVRSTIQSDFRTAWTLSIIDGDLLVLVWMAGTAQ